MHDLKLSTPAGRAGMARLLPPAYAVVEGRPADVAYAALKPGPDAARWQACPPQWRGMHSPQAMDRHWQRLMQLLRDPVQQLYTVRGEWAVMVVGVQWLHTGIGGLCSLVCDDDAADTVPRDLFDDEVLITELPAGDQWLARLARQAARHDRASGADVNRSDYFSWMFGVFKARMRRCCDLRAVRRRVSDMLALDPIAWNHAHRLPDPHRPVAKATLASYNRALDWQWDLRKVDEVAPAALGVYALLRERLADFDQTKGIEPLQDLRAFFRAAGLPARLWKLVVQDGERVLRIVRGFYRELDADALLDVLAILDRLEVKRVPPDALVQAIWSEYGNHATPSAAYLAEMQGCFEDLAHLIRVWPTDAAQTSRATRHLQLVVSDLTDPGRAPLTRRQRQQGWPWLVRRARLREARALLKRRRYRRRWSVPFSVTRLGGLRFIALDSTQALHQAGKVLHNCLGHRDFTYSRDFHLAVLATRGDGMPVAAAAYEWTEGRWSLTQALGDMNRSLAPATHALCAQLAAQIPPPQAAARDAAPDTAAVASADEGPTVAELAPLSQGALVRELGACTLELRVQRLDLGGADQARNFAFYRPPEEQVAIEVALFIGGRRIGEGAALDVLALTYAVLDTGGEAMLFNCGCGDPACCGVLRGVVVNRADKRDLVFTFPGELAQWAGLGDDPGEAVSVSLPETVWRDRCRTMWRELLGEAGVEPQRCRVALYDETLDRLLPTVHKLMGRLAPQRLRPTPGGSPA